MSFGILAEALARIEYKVDALLKKLVSTPHVPMHFIGQACPACNQPIDYTIDVNHQVVVRRCGCKTGKVPSTIPLIPNGVNNVDASTERPPEWSADGRQAEDSPGRKNR